LGRARADVGHLPSGPEQAAAHGQLRDAEATLERLDKARVHGGTDSPTAAADRANLDNILGGFARREHGFTVPIVTPSQASAATTGLKSPEEVRAYRETVEAARAKAAGTQHGSQLATTLGRLDDAAAIIERQDQALWRGGAGSPGDSILADRADLDATLAEVTSGEHGFTVRPPSERPLRVGRLSDATVRQYRNAIADAHSIIPKTPPGAARQVAAGWLREAEAAINRLDVMPVDGTPSAEYVAADRRILDEALQNIGAHAAQHGYRLNPAAPH
jgi:hypothetical protein